MQLELDAREERLADRYTPRALAAWRQSFFGSLPVECSRALLAASAEVRFDAGEVFYRGNRPESPVPLGVVASGLMRFRLRSIDGRMLTARYARPSEAIGVRALAQQLHARQNDSRGPSWARGTSAIDGEALLDSTVVCIPHSTVLRLIRQDVELAGALAFAVARQATDDTEMLAMNVFAPIRARVARHLLDVAIREGGSLVVRASHEEIAPMIGSVREVVSRALAALQDSGAVSRRGRALILNAPDALHRAATEI